MAVETETGAVEETEETEESGVVDQSEENQDESNEAVAGDSSEQVVDSEEPADTVQLQEEEEVEEAIAEDQGEPQEEETEITEETEQTEETEMAEPEQGTEEQEEEVVDDLQEEESTGSMYTVIDHLFFCSFEGAYVFLLVRLLCWRCYAACALRQGDGRVSTGPASLRHDCARALIGAAPIVLGDTNDVYNGPFNAWVASIDHSPRRLA